MPFWSFCADPGQEWAIVCFCLKSRGMEYFIQSPRQATETRWPRTRMPTHTHPRPVPPMPSPPRTDTLTHRRADCRRLDAHTNRCAARACTLHVHALERGARAQTHAGALAPAPTSARTRPCTRTRTPTRRLTCPRTQTRTHMRADRYTSKLHVC